MCTSGGLLGLLDLVSGEAMISSYETDHKVHYTVWGVNAPCCNDGHQWGSLEPGTTASDGSPG
jgi:hypothetical protein